MAFDPSRASWRREGPQRKRLRRIDVPGARFLTFSCFRDQPLLLDRRACGWLAESMELARERHGFSVWAYAFMPTHVHLVLLPKAEAAQVAPILTTIKQTVAKRAASAARNGDEGLFRRMMDRRPDGSVVLRFWQRGGGYDRNLRTARAVWNAIDYVHRNPVAAGLCARAAGWEWSSARRWATGEEVLVKLDLEQVPARPV